MFQALAALAIAVALTLFTLACNSQPEVIVVTATPDTPTATATTSPTATAAPTPTSIPTPTPRPSATPRPTPTPRPTATPTPTPVPSPMSQWEKRETDEGLAYLILYSKVYPERYVDAEYGGTTGFALTCAEKAIFPAVFIPEEPVKYSDEGTDLELQEISWYATTHMGRNGVARARQVVEAFSEDGALAFWYAGPAREAYLNLMSDISGKDFLEITVATVDYGTLIFEFPITGVDEVIAKLPCDVDW